MSMFIYIMGNYLNPYQTTGVVAPPKFISTDFKRFTLPFNEFGTLTSNPFHSLYQKEQNKIFTQHPPLFKSRYTVRVVAIQPVFFS